MEVVNAVFPILPGKTDDWQAWTDELAPGGSGRADWEEQNRRFGITGQVVSLQRTPHGDSFVVFFEVEDPGALLAGLAGSDNEYDKEFARKVMEIHGMDVNNPPLGPPAEIKLEFND